MEDEQAPGVGLLGSIPKCGMDDPAPVGAKEANTFSAHISPASKHLVDVPPVTERNGLLESGCARSG
jgi:hypothetical protein